MLTPGNSGMYDPCASFRGAELAACHRGAQDAIGMFPPEKLQGRLLAFRDLFGDQVVGQDVESPGSEVTRLTTLASRVSFDEGWVSLIRDDDFSNNTSTGAVDGGLGGGNSPVVDELLQQQCIVSCDACPFPFQNVTSEGGEGGDEDGQSMVPPDGFNGALLNGFNGRGIDKIVVIPPSNSRSWTDFLCVGAIGAVIAKGMDKLGDVAKRIWEGSNGRKRPYEGGAIPFSSGQCDTVAVLAPTAGWYDLESLRRSPTFQSFVGHVGQELSQKIQQLLQTELQAEQSQRKELEGRLEILEQRIRELTENLAGVEGIVGNQGSALGQHGIAIEALRIAFQQYQQFETEQQNLQYQQFETELQNLQRRLQEDDNRFRELENQLVALRQNINGDAEGGDLLNTGLLGRFTTLEGTIVEIRTAFGNWARYARAIGWLHRLIGENVGTTNWGTTIGVVLDRHGQTSNHPTPHTTTPPVSPRGTAAGSSITGGYVDALRELLSMRGGLNERSTLHEVVKAFCMNPEAFLGRLLPPR